MAVLDVVLENIPGGRRVVTMITRMLHALVDEPRVRLEIGLRRGLEGALITVVASFRLMLVLDSFQSTFFHIKGNHLLSLFPYLSLDF